VRFVPASGSRSRTIRIPPLALHHGKVTTVRSIVNPDKLDHLGRLESLSEVLDAARL
jgi:hypothetical protein